MLIESVLCLATVISHEARGSSLAAQHAVAQTVITRTNNQHMGTKTICETVYKPKQFQNVRKARKPLQKFKDLALEYLTTCSLNQIKYDIGPRIYFNRAFISRGRRVYRKYKTKHSLILVGLKGKQHGHY